MSAAVRAGDVHEFSSDFPLQIQDAFPTQQGSVQLQGTMRYENTEQHQDRLLLEPQLQWGFAKDWQLQLAVPILAGDADKTGSGDVDVSVLWNFLKESAPLPESPWPALAVELRGTIPTGRDSAGFDTAVSLIATKTLTTAPSQDRVHGEVTWEHNAGAAADERHDAFTLIAGYSRKLSDNTVLLADLFRRQEMQEHQDTTMAEIGLIHQLNDSWSIAAGLGVGLGDDSPQGRGTIAIQYSFQ